MKNVIVFDNGGATFDRYTILDKKTGDMWGASDNPFHPQGFGQYGGNVADNYWNVAYGYSWRRQGDARHINKLIRFAVSRFINEFPYGEEKNPIIDAETLPDDVKQFIAQSIPTTKKLTPTT